MTKISEAFIYTRRVAAPPRPPSQNYAHARPILPVPDPMLAGGRCAVCHVRSVGRCAARDLGGCVTVFLPSTVVRGR